MEALPRLRQGAPRWWQHPPLLPEAALRAPRRSHLALTGSWLRRPEETAGHAVAEQQVEALGLDALRGGRAVPVSPIPGASPHAAAAATHPAGTELPLLPHGRKPGGAPPTPRPSLLPARVGPLSARAPGPAPRPSLSTYGFSIQPLNHHQGGRALCWALGQDWGSDQDLLLRGWALQSGHRPLGGLLSPAPQGQPIAPSDPHQPSHCNLPPLGSPPALLRQSWFSSPDTS